MKTKAVAIALAALLLLLAAAVAAAAPDPVLARHVIAGGGSRLSDGATLVLYSTIGEPVATALAVTGDYGQAAGFWPGLSSGDHLYLPVVQK
jgi:hypothetical protein